MTWAWLGSFVFRLHGIWQHCSYDIFLWHQSRADSQLLFSLKCKVFGIFPSPCLLRPLSLSVVPPFPVRSSVHLRVKGWWCFDKQHLLMTDHISSCIHRLAGTLMRDGWVRWMLRCRARFTLMCLWITCYHLDRGSFQVSPGDLRVGILKAIELD